MQLALAQAQLAAECGEVPVGAVLVQNDQVLAARHNQPIAQHDPSAHAEVMVLRAAGEARQNYRLPNTTLYVTLEPCMMCVGAMVHARIERVVFGARDPKSGALCSVDHCANSPTLNHQLCWTADILAEPCAQILKDFFKQRR